MRTNYEGEQLSISGLDLWYGRMSPERSQVTGEGTSKPSSPRLRGLQSRTLPMFLYLKRGGEQGSGLKPEQLWGQVPTVGFPSLGEYSTHSFGESPNEENGSRLSQILEDSPHPKYCLSEKACRGILTRANKRGKKLPEELENALKAQAHYLSSNEPESQGGAREY